MPKYTKHFTNTYGKCSRAQAANRRVYLKWKLRILVLICCNSTGATAIFTTHWSDCSLSHGHAGYKRKRLQQVSIYINLGCLLPSFYSQFNLFSNTYAVRTYFLYIFYVLLGRLNCESENIKVLILHRTCTQSQAQLSFKSICMKDGNVQNTILRTKVHYGWPAHFLATKAGFRNWIPLPQRNIF